MANLNHQSSKIALIHGKLAAQKGWDFDGFADAIAKAASGKRGGHDYIKAFLYGRKPMPLHWKQALVKAVGISLDDYERQLKTELGQAANVASTPVRVENILPINYWPHFTWQSEFSEPRKIAARLYEISKQGICVKFSVMPGQWEPPTGFSNYPELCNAAWRELVENYSRMKKEPPTPKSVWHVSRISAASDSAVELEIMHADYRDIFVTATQRGLEHTIQTSSGSCTVRQWLAKAWKEGDCTKPVLPGVCHLVINIMVVTRDGYVVLSRQGSDSPESAGSWVTSVSSVVNPKTDCDSNEMPDLARAASRGCKEELNIETDAKSVRWLGLAVGLKLGSHTLFGMLETQLTRDEIRLAVAHNVQKARTDAARVCQVVEVEFLKLSPEHISQRLKSHDYRPYLELGLALLLWQNGDAKITDGLQKAFSKPKISEIKSRQK